MSVIRNLMVRAGADFSALKTEMSKAQKSVATFKENVSTQLSTIGPVVAAAAGAAGVLGLNSAVDDAVKVESAIQVLSRTLGSSAQDFMYWSETQAKALNMSKVEALDYGRTFAIMTKQFAKSTQENFQFTTDLLETAAITASGSGRTMQDTMERIASGMRGETDAIEDLGIMVGESTISQTQAFKRLAGDKSWAQLEENQKAQIRYYAILEQAANNYGTSLLQNGGTAIQQFRANIANLKLAFGDAFLPVINDFLPRLTDFVIASTERVRYLVEVMRSLFGYTAPAAEKTQKQVNKVASSFNQTTKNIKETTKTAKGALASFDEVNSLAEATADATNTIKDDMNKTGQNAGINFPSTSTQSEFQKRMDEIKKSAGEFSQNIKDAWTWLTTPIDFSWVDRLGEKFREILKLSLNIFRPLIPNKEEFSNATENVLTMIRTSFNSLGPFFKSVFEGVGKGIDSNKETIATKASEMFQRIKDVFSNPTTGVAMWAVNVFSRIWKAMEEKTFLEKLKTAADGMWTSIKSAFTGAKTWFTQNVANPIGEAIAGIKDRFKDGIGSGIKSILNDFIDMLNKSFADFNSFKNKFPLTNKIPDIPKIPKLARGGIVDSPTMAMVGEAGSELIMPLENTGFVDKMASALGSAVLSAMQVSGTGSNRSGGDVVLKIDGNAIARAINPYLAKETGRIGNTLISIT